VIMTLDTTVIFRGEIARACGGIEGGTEAFGDVSEHRHLVMRLYVDSKV